MTAVDWFMVCWVAALIAVLVTISVLFGRRKWKEYKEYKRTVRWFRMWGWR